VPGDDRSKDIVTRYAQIVVAESRISTPELEIRNKLLSN
jgi:hypothetical protein